MTDRGKSIIYGLLLVLAFAAGWVVNDWRTEGAAERQRTELARQAQADTEDQAKAVVTHGTAQQDNTHDYTQELARLEAGRTADAARIASLQHDIRAAATRNAQLAGDAAACRDLADQHQRLSAIAAEGAGVVGQLVGLVERRDAQVNALKTQLNIDRELLERGVPK